MKIWLLLISFLFTGLVSCHKNTEIASCPVSYSIDSTRQYNLLEVWDFIGFVDTAIDSTTSPLCGNIISNIIFTDSSSNSLSPPLQSPYNVYPYVYEGSALINYYYGTYTLIDSVHIAFSQTLNTKIVGVQQVADFEQRFHTVLQQVNIYRIRYNILTLYPDTGSIVMRFKADI